MRHIAGVDSRQMTLHIGCIEVFVDSLDLEAKDMKYGTEYSGKGAC